MTSEWVILDCETTGLDPRKDRIAEIAIIQFDGLNTGEYYHSYFNPQMRMPKEAERVHGLSDSFLKDKSLFSESSSALIEFIGSKKIIAHNADFDISFLNSELNRAGLPMLSNQVECSLKLARKQIKGSCSLDSLCKKFGIDTSKRGKHDALGDCKLLAKVWVELNGGVQGSINLPVKAKETIYPVHQGTRPFPLKDRLTEEERSKHKDLVKSLGRKAIWISCC